MKRLCSVVCLLLILVLPGCNAGQRQTAREWSGDHLGGVKDYVKKTITGQVASKVPGIQHLSATNLPSLAAAPNPTVLVAEGVQLVGQNNVASVEQEVKDAGEFLTDNENEPFASSEEFLNIRVCWMTAKSHLSQVKLSRDRGYSPSSTQVLTHQGYLDSSMLKLRKARVAFDEKYGEG